MPAPVQSSFLRRYFPAIAVLGIIAVIVALSVLGSGDGAAKPSAQAEQKLILAKKLLAQDDASGALAAIREIEREAGTKGLDEATAYLKLQALDLAADHEELATASADFLTRFPKSERKADAEVLHLAAEVQTAGLSNPGLLQSVEKFVAANPDNPHTADLTLALARQELAMGDTAAAQRRMNAALETKGADPAAVANMRQELGALNLAALYKGNAPGIKETSYKIKSGDSIWGISRQFNVTSEFLTRVNDIKDPAKLRLGQTLRVPQVQFSLVCDISTNTLTLYGNGEFLKAYTVRTGRDADSTPVGDFKVLNKKKDPTWKPGDGKTYLPGDPNNELGSRWMSFEGDILGIHGTIHPETIGNYASNGCIGMLKDDVEELYDLIGVGTPLKITGKQDLTQAKVIPAAPLATPLTEREIASRQ